MLQIADPTGARDRGANENIDPRAPRPQRQPQSPQPTPTFVQDTSEPSASAPNTQL
ncbi:hypothetical protein QBC32DRAFT_319151 [Pseudoneurospora amorphoporcata]|uniref:Uncharacterized protein n=1 Tax=Pseudoneurospora amorphoporcata TaxID=241081 RepID=A0AAN6NKD2_9PEZI|nr:hypothetical protein QBC32DRAFT_319151 [Pseudoneurospora amorphoporcata]